MPSLERSMRVAADPDALRRTLAAVERWPAWCPLLRTAEPAELPDGSAGAWSIVALLGAMPFSAVARLSHSDDGEQITLATLTSASPVDYARYTFTIRTEDEPAIALRIDYGFARGPGGWLVERLLVRRRLPAQIDATLTALATPP